MRKTYRLLKDSPELKKGTILEEMCDDGTQPFNVQTKEGHKFEDQGRTQYSRDTVMKNPKWFEEVESIYIAKKKSRKTKKTK